MDAATQGIMARSLAEFGDLSGITVNKRTGLLVGGHQRADVLRDGRMDVRDLPKPDPDGTVARGYLEHLGRRYAVRVVDWDEDRAHAALLAANRFGRLGQDDNAILKDLLEQVDRGQKTDTGALLADLTGFDEAERERLMTQVHQDDTYTNKIVAPVYEPKGDNPPIATLIDRTKTDRLQAEIAAAKLPPDVARFLTDAAERHTVFHFGRIAEWYCHATPQVQDLMEKSGMVIIDFKKAIEYGFVHLTERLGELADLEESDGDA
jgi:hypothetical protein